MGQTLTSKEKKTFFGKAKGKMHCVWLLFSYFLTPPEVATVSCLCMQGARRDRPKKNYPGFGLICISLGKIDRNSKNGFFFPRFCLPVLEISPRAIMLFHQDRWRPWNFLKNNIFVGVWRATVSDFADVQKIWGTERCGAFFDVKDPGGRAFSHPGRHFFILAFWNFRGTMIQSVPLKTGGQKKEEEEEEKRRKSYLPTFSLYVTLVVERGFFFVS